MDAVADLGGRIRNLCRMQPFIDGCPRLPAIVSPERTSCRDRDVNAVGIAGVDENRVQTQTAGAWLPFGCGPVFAEGGELFPRLRAVSRTKKRRVLHAGVDHVGIVER